MVVYGENASGKSSFVDAIEYMLNEGRISHLAHEYSGKRQQNAVPNTHKPSSVKTRVDVKLCDGSEVLTEIEDDGSSINRGAAVNVIRGWDYRRTVLRQEDVASFINETKGQKYSALLPLFGLQELEIAAENLRQLVKNVEGLSQVSQRKARLADLERRREATFGAESDEEIERKIRVLHRKYCFDKPGTDSRLACCTEVMAAIDRRTAQFSADQRRYLCLRTVAEVEIKAKVERLRASNLVLADVADPLISERLAVLEATKNLTGLLKDEATVQCPACGRSIPAEQLRDHVLVELRRLGEIKRAVDSRKVAMESLSGSLDALKRAVANTDLKGWREKLVGSALAEPLSKLEALAPGTFRNTCSEADLKMIEEKLLPIVDAAARATTNPPTDVKQILDDKRTVETAEAVIEGEAASAQLKRAETLVSLLGTLERVVRGEIRSCSNAVIAEISEDIKQMWLVLHPNEAIDDVHLYTTDYSDKAIDIGLRFHGKPQDSPRLTLSEGYRNSLGLCIFLAMAKRGATDDNPVFLDDVVVSLDRRHRGMIAEIIRESFGARQVLILTHDRDWYAELRHQLGGGDWTFSALLPYEDPLTGIRWSLKNTAFDDARAQLGVRPASAGNDARKIMDVELAIAAEGVQLKLPFLRFERNDRRTAHDFLQHLMAEGKRRLQRRQGEGFAVNTDAIEALRAADVLLVTWANRASHSFDVVRPEAEKLIDACERALDFLHCPSCAKPVWFTDAKGSKWVQCRCGEVRWRYG